MSSIRKTHMLLYYFITLDIFIKNEQRGGNVVKDKLHHKGLKASDPAFIRRSPSFAFSF